jgi:hypothetical protein
MESQAHIVVVVEDGLITPHPGVEQLEMVDGRKRMRGSEGRSLKLVEEQLEMAVAEVEEAVMGNPPRNLKLVEEQLEMVDGGVVPGAEMEEVVLGDQVEMATLLLQVAMEQVAMQPAEHQVLIAGGNTSSGGIGRKAKARASGSMEAGKPSWLARARAGAGARALRHQMMEATLLRPLRRRIRQAQATLRRHTHLQKSYA